MKNLFFYFSATFLLVLAVNSCGKSDCEGKDCRLKLDPMADGFSHIAFVTSMRLPGNLGGLQGADALCEKFANVGTATQVRGGTWKSILSDSKSSARDRLLFKKGAAIKNTKDETVVEDSSLFWNGSLQAAIQFDENGQAVSNKLEVWTGSLSDGRAVEGPSLVSSCTDWQDGSTIANGGVVGILNSKEASWIQSEDFIGCAPTEGKARLYCVNSL